MPFQSESSLDRLRHPRRTRQYLALLTFFLMAVLLVVLAPSSATSAAEMPIQSAKLSQAGKSLILQIRTSRNVNMRRLDRRPDFTRSNGRYLCLELGRNGSKATRRICLGGRTSTYDALGVSLTNAMGVVKTTKVIPAKVRKIGGLKIIATFDPSDAGLASGPYAWQIADRAGSCPRSGPLEKASRDDCLTLYPPKRRATYDLRPIQTIGCTGGNGEFVTHGPRGSKRVALTFDDGPSDYTPDVLKVLKRKHVKATFFMLGQQVASYPTYARRVLAQGHEVANHSYDHDLLPSGSNIRHATRTITEVTGFRPCLFRPPYGAVSGSLKKSAKDDDMKVVNWDVDTTDWKLPGSAAIASTIVHQSRSGSIVLMHDGGGPRSGTVDALADAIGGLRKRGFEFVTVSELLGNRMIYRPKP